MYIATVNMDFIGKTDNGYNRLLNALEQVGWQYSGTSAMVLIDGDLREVLWGLEVLARGAAHCGADLGALSIQVQEVGFPRPAPAAQFQRQALRNVSSLPLPSEWS